MQQWLQSQPTQRGKDTPFAGWYSDSNLTTPYTFTTMSAENITIYGKWDIVNYQIDYYLDDGVNNGLNPISYTITTNTITLNDPMKEGYTFLGWYDNNMFEGSSVTHIEKGSIGDITFYAKWDINSYIISYNTFDNYDPSSDIMLKSGETIVKVSLGEYHSSALTSMGRLFIWGYNHYGELGIGTQDWNPHPKPIEITNHFPTLLMARKLSISL